jgi:zinc protease
MPDSDDPYALMVAMGILDGGQSARFEKHIVREDQVASFVYAMYSAEMRFETLMMFAGLAMPQVSIEHLERAIHKEIKQLQNEVVEAEELELAKMRLKAKVAFLQDDPLRRLHWLSQYEALSLEAEQAHEWVDRIDAITAEQVQQVAQRYLIPSRQIKAVAMPLEGDLENA